MNRLQPGFFALKLGKKIPSPPPSERTWVPGQPHSVDVQTPSHPHPVNIEVQPRPHSIIAVLMPSVKMTHEEAKAALAKFRIEDTPENWENAFQGFLDSADLGKDTELRMNAVSKMVSRVQTMEQAIALVSRRGTLFAYLPPELQASVPVKVAAVVGSRSLQETKALIKADQLRKLLQRLFVSREAHKILEMTIRILESSQRDAMESAKELKLELSAHPDWPSYFESVA
jgi:hypothetical protein